MDTNNATAKPWLSANDLCHPDPGVGPKPQRHDGIWTMGGPLKPGGEGQRPPVYGVWMVDPAARHPTAKSPGHQPPSGVPIRRGTTGRHG